MLADSPFLGVVEECLQSCGSSRRRPLGRGSWGSRRLSLPRYSVRWRRESARQRAHRTRSNVRVNSAFRAQRSQRPTTVAGTVLATSMPACPAQWQVTCSRFRRRHGRAARRSPWSLPGSSPSPFWCSSSPREDVRRRASQCRNRWVLGNFPPAPRRRVPPAPGGRAIREPKGHSLTRSRRPTAAAR